MAGCRAEGCNRPVKTIPLCLQFRSHACMFIAGILASAKRILYANEVPEIAGNVVGSRRVPKWFWRCARVRRQPRISLPISDLGHEAIGVLVPGFGIPTSLGGKLEVGPMIETVIDLCGAPAWYAVGVS